MKRIVSLCSLLTLSLFTVPLALALNIGDGNPPDDSIGTIAKTLVSNYKSLTSLITATSYVAGFGFCAGAIMKFKAHKDNPTQIGIGAPISLLFVGSALVFLPYLLSAGGYSLFGSDASSSSPTGTYALPNEGSGSED